MALELKFSKSNKETQWGFRIVGGADFDQPLVVVKVNENSIAEQAGLQVGDLIVRINDTATTGLTHTEVHDLLISVGLEFEIAVRRGEFSELIRSDEDYNVEFQNMVAEIERSVEQDIIQEAIEQIQTGKQEVSADIYLSENLAGQEEMVYTKDIQTSKTFTDTITHGIKTNKKWSTFLMKPDQPVPKPKKIIEQEKAKEDGYKVVISKQPLHRAFMKPEKKVQFDQTVTEVDAPLEENEYNNENQNIDSTEDANEPNAEIDDDEDNIDRDSIDGIPDIVDEYVTNELNNNTEIDDYPNELQNETIEIHYKPLSEIKVDDSESAMTLEEQLRAVQKQLQTLSQLPSAVQLTLDAISAQLATIVSTKENETEDKEENNEIENRQSEEYGEEYSISEKAQAEVHLTDGEDANSVIGDELEEDVITDEIREIMKRTEKEEEEENEERRRIEEEENEERRRIEEEEEKARIEEEERLAKQQKEMEDRMKHVQRPIILPGGRKWIDPEDAIPSFRKPKMSEEKIMETIDSSLEVIAGKRKGINFLKYQPPAKNLDYLQRSQVYRLVHDMEPPVKGIVSRPEMVPAVQDYYEASHDAP